MPKKKKKSAKKKVKKTPSPMQPSADRKKPRKLLDSLFASGPRTRKRK